MKAQLLTTEQVCQFMFAGKATLTLQSNKTQRHFTYRVEASDDGTKHFVKVLNGPDNESNYKYLGFFAGPDYIHGRKSSVSQDAPSAIAMQWFARQLRRHDLTKQVSVFHVGKCGRCGRKLTTPESIQRGIGPECAEKL